MNRAAALCIALLLACIPGAQAERPATKALRVLFVGNSLTFTGDIPARLEKLARAMGRGASVEAVAFPDFSLEDHWRDGRATAAIAKGWDVVVLQQGPSAAPESREQLIEYARRFAKPIRAAGAKPALYMVWPRSDRLRDFAAGIASYRAAAEAVEGIVLPVGEAWLRALSADKRLRLYRDTIHPASLGADLAVLTIYLALFPAGPQEFDDAFVAKVSAVLEIPTDRRDLLFDAATRAIDEPMSLK